MARARHRRRTVPTSGQVFESAYRKYFALAIVIALLGLVAMSAVVTLSPSANRFSHERVTSSFSLASDLQQPRLMAKLARQGTLPVVGQGRDAILTRVAEVKTVRGQTYLVDPFSGNILRQPSQDELLEIGNNRFVVDRFGVLGKRQIALTFDDGPDPQQTPQILDILYHEQVPATFFVLGENVPMASDVLQRIVREGHMIGNHTLTHLDFDKPVEVLEFLRPIMPDSWFDVIGDWRNGLEVSLTDRLIRSAAGYHTSIARLPGGDPENEIVGDLALQQAGQLNVDWNSDTHDWRLGPGQPVTMPVLNPDEPGQVILLHDAGGDRKATIEALEQFIRTAKQQGYSFVTLDSLLPPEHRPQADATPSLADHISYGTIWTGYELPEILLYWLLRIAIAAGVVQLLYVGLVWLNRLVMYNDRLKRLLRLETSDYPPHQLPVYVVITAYNEAKTIEQTLESLLEAVHPVRGWPVEAVLVVNDGSTDSTSQKVDLQSIIWLNDHGIRLELINKPNGGKATALDLAFKRIDDEVGEGDAIIVTIDADVIVPPDTVTELIKPFDNPDVGIAAGNIQVNGPDKSLTPWGRFLRSWQDLDFSIGVGVVRTAEVMMNAVSVVPGALSAWRLEAVRYITYPNDTLAEDADMTLQVQRSPYRRWRVVQVREAVAYTQAHRTVRALWRQRMRWAWGMLQVLWKHSSMVWPWQWRKYGLLSMVALPYAMLATFIRIGFGPLVVIGLVVSLFGGNLSSIAAFAGLVLALRLLQTVTAIILLNKSWWLLGTALVERFFYEPLQLCLSVGAFLRWCTGKSYRWGNSQRYGEARAGSTTVADLTPSTVQDQAIA